MATDDKDPITKKWSRATKAYRELDNPNDQVWLTFLLIDSSLYFYANYKDTRIRTNAITEMDSLFIVLEGGDIVRLGAIQASKSQWLDGSGAETTGIYSIEPEQIEQLANADWTMVRMELAKGNEDFDIRQSKKHRANANCILEIWRATYPTK